MRKRALKSVGTQVRTYASSIPNTSKACSPYARINSQRTRITIKQDSIKFQQTPIPKPNIPTSLPNRNHRPAITGPQSFHSDVATNSPSATDPVKRQKLIPAPKTQNAMFARSLTSKKGKSMER